MQAAEAVAAPEESKQDSEVLHVDEESFEEVQETKPPVPSIPENQAVAFDTIDEDEPTCTDNPVFVQNVWELPPQRGFYLEDIIEERTCDLAQSGYVMAPSGLIAQPTLDGAAGGTVETPSQSKKLSLVSGLQSLHEKKNSASSLHQSLQDNTEHSLQDSLSDV